MPAQAIRGALMKHTGVTPPELPAPIPVKDYGEVALAQSALLLEQLAELFPGDGVEAEQPDIMEEYGQS
jgi:beta-galactosidase